MMLSSSELARTLGVTPGRVSQYVAAGSLDGCFSGSGRARRFDLEKVAAALGKSLDPGQMMGNGAGTRAALKEIQAGGAAQPPAPVARRSQPTTSGATELGDNDPERYKLARTEKAEEEARRLRRQNAEAEGRFVLASEVNHTVARMIGQEIAEVETVLRDGARKIADDMGVDFKTARQILVNTWREHRGKRSNQLDLQAKAAELTETEALENI
jgi:hypothetical protein